MQHEQLKRWQHSHSFGQDLKRPGESRTLLVIALTFVMMLVEIAAGIAYGLPYCDIGHQRLCLCASPRSQQQI